jgi:hypothetical protein
MIQPAKIIGTGLATTDLIGVVFKALILGVAGYVVFSQPSKPIRKIWSSTDTISNPFWKSTYCLFTKGVNVLVLPG